MSTYDIVRIVMAVFLISMLAYNTRAAMLAEPRSKARASATAWAVVIAVALLTPYRPR